MPPPARQKSQVRQACQKSRRQSPKASQTATMRDHAHTLSDFHIPTLSIECEACGRAGRYSAGMAYGWLSWFISS
jgi:hypothetical protein